MPQPSALHLAIVITVAVAAISLLIPWDQHTDAAVAREVRGLSRGQIVSAGGQPLVRTDEAGRVEYAFPDLAGVLGYRSADGEWTGLEEKYDPQLSGASARHDWRTFFLHLTGRSVRGDRLRLTIDPVVQRAAERGLGRNPGAVVAINPATGGILALVSHPFCSPVRLASASGLASCRRSQAHPLLDRATSFRAAPGSTFKIVTLTAALDTGRFSLNTLFSGSDVFGPSPYFDNSEYPSNINRTDLTAITLKQALAFSDNFTYAHVGLTLGARVLRTYAHRYFIGRQIPFDLPVVSSSVLAGKAQPSKSDIARSSFGARVDQVTPLQMALIAATVANHGTMMAPHLVNSIEGPHGRLLWHYPVHVLSRVMRRRTAAEVTAGMEFVVTAGSGFEAQIPGVAVAGKTGTAADSANTPHAWFISFAPAGHPVIAVAVLHEFGGEGYEYAAPIARQVMLARLREIRPRN